MADRDYAKLQVADLLELTKQYRHRFTELEKIEWRINFSTWGALGGTALLWSNGHIDAPDWIYSPLGGLVIAVPMLVHFFAVVRLNAQQQEYAGLAYEARDRARAILRLRDLRGKRDGASDSKPDEQLIFPTQLHIRLWRFLRRLRWTDWLWVTWEVTVTGLIAFALTLVIQHVR